MIQLKRARKPRLLRQGLTFLVRLDWQGILPATPRLRMTQRAYFGTLFGGDGGRNYMRTVASDYATVPFVAEITLDVTGPVLSNQQAFFGLGRGDTALFGVPDWSTQNASTWVQPEISGGNPLFTTFRSNNDANQFVNFPAAGYASGTHRMRMTFDPVAKTMIYAIDFNYAGGPFTADITAPTVDLNHVDCPRRLRQSEPAAVG